MADTYPLKPNRITVTTIRHKTTVATFERGNEQRMSNWKKGKKEFELKHYNLSIEERDQIIAFHEDRHGSLRKFYFANHVDNLVYVVRFAEDSLSIDHANAYSFNLTARVIEC
ncbi:DUF2460 domain-containing protein [Limisalsivibrio acetivorans]|uniref:DUF2460 domain-containing protein n=1 Tax=Limisalsivibrio acetivorans TaxID=1304888 RepID=UPI0003B3792B|nr:DUF2460 domain-containing protein [Limisalsivibrio acetivorans]